jgi:hypothetical protein
MIFSAQQGAGYHRPLDVVSGLVDLGDLGVAHEPLDGEVRGIAGAAEQSHGPSDREFIDNQLGHVDARKASHGGNLRCPSLGLAVAITSQ